MAFDAFKPVFLVTDILLFLLALVTVGFGVYASRREHYRLAWAQLRARRLPMACMGVILLYACVALLDSVHYQKRAYAAEDAPQVDERGEAVYRSEIISLLDDLCAGLRARGEKTFSAPLATRQFTKELVTRPDGSVGRDFPRLLHGGSHLTNESERNADVLGLVLLGLSRGVLVAITLGAAILGLVYVLARRHGGGSTSGAIKSGVEIGIFVGCFAVLVTVLWFVSSKYHVLGTGQVGQDVLYSALKGCRVGLVVGVLTTLIATPLAVLLGIMAGYLGQRVDDAVQYVYTTLSAIPDILLIAAVMLIVSTRLDTAHSTYAGDTRLVWLCVILGIGSWTGLCRLIRGEALKLRELEYIHAAEVLGVGRLKIMLRHILPNVVHIVLISVVLRFSGLVLAEAVLAYVGIGVDPSMESWGNMINAAGLDISRDPIVWWNLLAAFLFMFGLVLPANIFGDAVRDALDPRLQAGGGLGMEEKAEDGNEVLLRVRDLQTYFRTGSGVARAVDGVSFDIKRGETYALVGESGCGKSVTALSIIQLIQKPAGFIAGGRVEYKGQDILRLPEMEKRRFRGNEIAMIFQEPMSSLNPVMTVGAQIVEAILRHQPALPQAQAQHQAIEMLKRVRMPEAEQRFSEYPHQLSGGMRQRVMIAMALSCQPGLLIADEPTTALDVTIQEQILGLIRDIQQEFGTAVLMITHDLGVVAENAHRVGVMYAGKIVEEAERSALFRQPSHPYTAKLLESLPKLDQREQALETIDGRVPVATQFPDHCRFADRCHMVMEVCRQRPPDVFSPQAGHQVACHLYDETLMGRRVDPLEVRSKPRGRNRVADTDTPDVLLEVRKLKVWFPIRRGVLRRTVGHVKAVDGVDLRIRRGRTLALVGESGCGKTTLGRGLIQLVQPTAGQVQYQGEELIGLSRAALKQYRRRLQMVFQDPYSSLNPRMMVGEIISEGMEAHGMGAHRKERLERAGDLLEQVGLEAGMVTRYPHEFSGGQRQRLGIARCLAVEPEFIICDEATSALDVSVQAQIINLLEDLQDRLGLTYLLITHDLSVVSHMADEVAVMYLGRIVEQGRRDEIFTDPKHPYTRALLAAIPQVDADSGRQKIHLGGDVPSPVNPPLGCHFHPRCPDRFDHCPSAYPGATHFSTTHSARCFLHDGAND